jgi:hypothetical protein
MSRPRRRPALDEQERTARLFAPPDEPTPRLSLWQVMAHRVGTCVPSECPLCAAEGRPDSRPPGV